MHLYEVAQLGGNDEDVGSQRHLTEALKLLVVHVHLVHRRVQRVVTGGENKTREQREGGALMSEQPQSREKNGTFFLRTLPSLSQHVLQYACKSVRSGAAATQDVFSINTGVTPLTELIRAWLRGLLTGTLDRVTLSIPFLTVLHCCGE